MSLDHYDVLLKLQTRLLSLSVATTGVTTLGVTGNAFTRATGSFVTDGFVPGMEVVPVGFADLTPEIVDSVEALTLGTRGNREDEVADVGRSLTVGIPSQTSWENQEIEPVAGRWRLDEDFLPGPKRRVGLGANSENEHTPQYVLKLIGVPGGGAQAMYNVADAILDLFPPRYSITLGSGRALNVRTDPEPERGQILTINGEPTIVITIPLITRTPNPV